MDSVVREVYARTEGNGVSLVGMNGQGWELCQIVLADNKVLVAGLEDKLQKL